MNSFMESYIVGACTYLKAFEQSLRMAALKNDGKIDKQEQKALDKANKLTEKYIKELKKLVE